MALDFDSEHFLRRKTEISHNLEIVKSNIARAAAASGRNPDDIKLIVVTKYYPTMDVCALASLGQKDFAENRVQDLMQKMEELDASTDLHWHMIGTLQRNKVKYISGQVDLIHSVDSTRLAHEIHKRAILNGKKENILFQFNITGEETKHGFNPKHFDEAFKELSELDGLVLKGFMTMSALGASTQDIEHTFIQTQNLFYQYKERLTPEQRKAFTELSMGMSDDYELAVRSGATLIRVGSAILKSRTDDLD